MLPITRHLEETDILCASRYRLIQLIQNVAKRRSVSKLGIRFSAVVGVINTQAPDCIVLARHWYRIE